MKKLSAKERGENRQAALLRYFREGNTGTAVTLGGRFGVGERTIRNDIRWLNGELSGSGIIERKDGEYGLVVLDNDTFRLIYASLIETDDKFNSPAARRDYCLGRLMRATESVLTDELAYEMNIGRSTLIADLKKMREELAFYDIHIEGKTARGLVMTGVDSIF